MADSVSPICNICVSLLGVLWLTVSPRCNICVSLLGVLWLTLFLLDVIFVSVY
jgi:hypothetical protein